MSMNPRRDSRGMAPTGYPPPNRAGYVVPLLLAIPAAAFFGLLIHPLWILPLLLVGVVASGWIRTRA